ncbi:Uncharacterized protein APZ42_004753 [Daphnia magna]|uniref:Uncharacterized protein n=1 Tax=Daphnia magna TaxID=35525 RepID=A0A162EZZ5_9CRUS|nr:Uncharacterized protein APZ42_004753 [Daphnia magna]
MSGVLHFRKDFHLSTVCSRGKVRFIFKIKEKKYFHNKCQEHLSGNCDFEKHRKLFSHRRCFLSLDNHLVVLRPTEFVSLEGVITVIDIQIPLYVPTACINKSCTAVECWRFQN